MLIYGDNKYSGDWNSENIWSQVLKRSSSSAAATPQPPTKRPKLSLKNRQFLSSLGFRVYRFKDE